jgi:uncharacterized membrane-anchored protein
MKRRTVSEGQRERSFEERLREYPELRERLEVLLGVVENADGDVVKADEAEQRVVEELRQMGQAALQGWARRKHERIVKECQGRADLTSNGKKNSAGTRGSEKL